MVSIADGDDLPLCVRISADAVITVVTDQVWMQYIYLADTREDSIKYAYEFFLKWIRHPAC